MKRYLIVLFSLILFSASAQDKPSFVALRSGASVPIGNYASKKLPDGQFTTTGLNFSVEGAWFFKSWIGVGGYIGYDVHPVDVSSLGQAKVEKDPFLEDVTIRSDPYRLVQGLVGVYFNYAFSERWSMTAKATGGMMVGASPYQLYKPQYFLVEPKWYEITSARDYGFSLLGGIGARYALKSCIGFLFNADLTYSQLDFDFRLAGGKIRTEHVEPLYLILDLGVYFKL